MMTKTTNHFTCFNCGESKPIQTNGGAGYATCDGGELCYTCCAIGDAITMEATGKIVLYWHRRRVESKDFPGGYWHEDTISNWPGSLTFKAGAIRSGAHNIAGKQTTIYFNAFGETWSGRHMGDNEILRCRRLSRKRVS